MYLVRAHDYAVGLHEVLNSGTLLQEFGIRHDVEVVFGFFLYDFTDLIRRTHRHRGFGDDNLVPVHRTANARGNFTNRGQIRCTSRRGRSSHSDENDERFLYGGINVRGKRKSFLTRVPLNDLRKARFVNRNDAFLQLCDLLGVVIDADHIVAAFSKARTYNQSNIARSNDANVHFYSR